MTTSRYFWARLALIFGFTRHTKRLSDAATESHLLRDAELFLGQRVWEAVGDIEELNLEYWSLRRLHSKYEKVKKILSETSDELTAAHEKRAEVLMQRSEEVERLEELKAGKIKKLEELIIRRDQTIEEARRIRKIYDGTKTKIEVLQEEAPHQQAEIQTSTRRLKEIREDFKDLKKVRDGIVEKIELLEQEINDLNQKHETIRESRRQKSQAGFQVIGDANRQISRTKVEHGELLAVMNQHYQSIGRFVSLNHASDNRTQKAVRQQKQLVEIMAALRKSIELNQRLAKIS